VSRVKVGERYTIEEAAEFLGRNLATVRSWTHQRGARAWYDRRCAERRVDLVALFIWLRMREDKRRREVGDRARLKQIETWNREKGDRLPRCSGCTEEDPVEACCFFLRRDYVRKQLGHPRTDYHEQEVKWREATAPILNHRLTLRVQVQEAIDLDRPVVCSAGVGFAPAGGGWRRTLASRNTGRNRP
jgi:hypothetical protein